MKIEFTINGQPPKHTAQGSSMILKSKKTGKFFIGKKADSNAVQDKNYLLAMLVPHRPETPLRGALKCEIELFYLWRKSETKKNIAKGEMPVTTKPDCDNLAKQILDCLTKLAFWSDDAQVFDLRIVKKYSSNPKTVFKIEEINQ